ncbi:hypothetical protein LZG07_16495 [Microbacterium profundi]|uniref:hypothetical protein n=1 Tax=Microbacterium profundi TaxID=450380 RepID=UPI001F3D85CE|nr:hypothetical protein [Microbacterium profundi]MCE7483498.1 hypothetical protein [Microbacterium profundi]
MDKKPRIVFERGSIDRLGLLVGVQRKQLSARWEDGSEETVTSGQFVHADVDSATFVAFAMPGTRDQLWRDPDSASQFIVALLGELRAVSQTESPATPANNKITWRDLRKHVMNKLSPPAMTQAQWDDLHERVKQHPAIEMKNSQLSFRESAQVPDLVPSAIRDRWEALLKSTMALSSEQPESQDDVPSALFWAEEGSIGGASRSSTALIPPADTSRVALPNEDIWVQLKAAKSSEQRERLLRVLRSQRPIPLDDFIATLVYGQRVDGKLAKRLSTDPTGQTLSEPKVPPSVIRGAITSLPEQDRPRAIGSLLLVKDAVGRDLLTEWAALPESPPMLELLSRRISKLNGMARTTAVVGVRKAADALLQSRRPSNAAGSMLHTLELLSQGTKPDIEVANELARSMATHLSTPLEPNELPHIKAALRQLPLTAGGGRVRVLAKVASITPDADSTWLDGISVDDLLGQAAPDAERLAQAPAWKHKIQHLAEGAIRSASSRSRLFHVLGSAVITRDLDPTIVAKSFERVATGDSDMRQWMRLLSHEQETAQLVRDLAASESKAAAAALERAQAEELAARLRATSEDLHRRLDSAAKGASDDSAAAMRHVEIDILRRMSRILSALEGDVRRLSADELLTRLRQQLRTLDIEVIHAADEVVPYDPEVHMIPGGTPNAGVPVRVGRPGYKWIQEDGDILLVKAIVATES